MKLRIEGTRFLSILIVLVFVFWVSSAAMTDSSVPERHADKKFVEKPGVREFSGRLIARPFQVNAWKAKGLSHQEAVDRVAKAREIIESKKVIRHVWQTDEYIVRVPAGATEATVSNALMANGLFQYAEPDWIVYPILVSNDPMFGDQWHHNSNRMQSADGWGIHTGNPSVGVGICDTGIRTTHEDLQLHRLEGYNAVDREWEFDGGNIGPVHPHGTWTTGCAAANGDNGFGVAGVGWNLSHRMLRVSNSSGGGAYISTLNHAARTSIESGDRVASVSYSGVDSSSNLTTAKYIKSIGGLLVWAAGNDGRNLTYGNRDNDDIIVAGGTDSNDNLAYFSAYGQFVDVTAPAVSVCTTDAGNDSDYACVSGTSFATPLTAGLAALIWSYYPSLTPDEVESILKQGCDDLGSSGVDNTYGYGRIDVFGSLSLAESGNLLPVADLSANPTSGEVLLSVDFDASGSFDPDGSIHNFEWDWEGDGTYDHSTGTNPYTTHPYSVAAGYNATVRVTDNEGANDTASVLITVTDSGGPGVPAAPNNLTAEAIKSGKGRNKNLERVELQWNDNSDNEAHFVIQRCTVSGKGKARTCSFDLLGTASADNTTYTDTSPDSGNTYRYRVRAENIAGASNWSNEAQCK